MTRVVKVGEAKTHLSELLKLVEAGEEVIIARGDVQIARLAPIDEAARRKAAVDAFIEARDKAKIKPVTLDENLAWRHEGHRY